MCARKDMSLNARSISALVICLMQICLDTKQCTAVFRGQNEYAEAAASKRIHNLAYAPFNVVPSQHKCSTATRG